MWLQSWTLESSHVLLLCAQSLRSPPPSALLAFPFPSSEYLGEVRARSRAAWEGSSQLCDAGDLNHPGVPTAINKRCRGVLGIKSQALLILGNADLWPPHTAHRLCTLPHKGSTR